MSRSTTKDVKKEQKKSLYLRHLSELLRLLSENESAVSKVYITRVDFSNDTGMCYIYFSTYSDENRDEAFKDALEVLKLYKGSLRKALSKQIHSRYVPSLHFLYDEKREKQRQIESLLDQVHEDLEKTGES